MSITIGDQEFEFEGEIFLLEALASLPLPELAYDDVIHLVSAYDNEITTCLTVQISDLASSNALVIKKGFPGIIEQVESAYSELMQFGNLKRPSPKLVALLERVNSLKTGCKRVNLSHCGINSLYTQDILRSVVELVVEYLLNKHDYYSAGSILTHNTLKLLNGDLSQQTAVIDLQEEHLLVIVCGSPALASLTKNPSAQIALQIDDLLGDAFSLHVKIVGRTARDCNVRVTWDTPLLDILEEAGCSLDCTISVLAAHYTRYGYRRIISTCISARKLCNLPVRQLGEYCADGVLLVNHV